MRSRVLDGVLGLCIGDACGVPVEGSQKSEREIKPVMDMIGYGTYFQPPGTWSDDSSMTLATVDSLCNGLDYDDLMKKFLSWYEQADYTAYDEVFDIGNVTRKALRNYDGTRPAYECGGAREKDNGNGSLMRILPVIYYLRGRYADGYYITEEGYEIVHRLSAMTHAHPISQIACGIYVSVAFSFMDAQPMARGQEAVRAAFRFYRKSPRFKGWIERFQSIEDLSEVERLQKKEVQSTGYVVDTLEAALWSFLTTDNYRDCILKAVNLGGDTDTVAALAGGLAGLKYGVEGIPKKWVSQLAKKEEITRLCMRLETEMRKREAHRFDLGISYLSQKIGKDVCQWKGVEPVAENVYHFSYAVYEKPIYDLMENEIPHSLFMCPDYARLLEEAGITSLEEGIEKLNQSNLLLCSAILSAFVRKERFKEGYWNQIVRDGILLKVLQRIQELCYDTQ